MKALAMTTLALCGVAVSGLRSHKLAQTFAQVDLPADTNTHTCNQAVKRVNSQNNFNYTAVIKAGTKWTDPTYGGSDAIYWHDFDEGNMDGLIS